MRRTPQQVPPTGIVLEYTRALVGVVARTRTLFQPVAVELPGLLASVRREQLVTDAGEGERVRQLLAEFRASIAFAFDDGTLAALTARFAQRLSTHNRLQLFRQARVALGVDLFVDDARLAAELDGFVTRNVALIKAIPESTATGIERLVTDAVSRGRRHKDLAVDIAGEWALGKKRAQLIARDQVLTGYGRINAHRQRELGVKEFIWRTVNDRRVRGKPGGAYPNTKPSHDARNGVTYKYSDPPMGELPGEPVLCRCQAEPVWPEGLL